MLLPNNFSSSFNVCILKGHYRGLALQSLGYLTVRRKGGAKPNQEISTHGSHRATTDTDLSYRRLSGLPLLSLLSNWGSPSLKLRLNGSKKSYCLSLTRLQRSRCLTASHAAHNFILLGASCQESLGTCGQAELEEENRRQEGLWSQDLKCAGAHTSPLSSCMEGRGGRPLPKALCGLSSCQLKPLCTQGVCPPPVSKQKEQSQSLLRTTGPPTWLRVCPSTSLGAWGRRGSGFQWGWIDLRDLVTGSWWGRGLGF